MARSKASARMAALLAAGDGTGLEEGLLERGSTSTMRGEGASLHHEDERGEVDEERAMLQRRIQDPKWRLDRGAGYYAQQRERLKLASMVQTGR